MDTNDSEGICLFFRSVSRRRRVAGVRKDWKTCLTSQKRISSIEKMNFTADKEKNVNLCI